MSKYCYWCEGILNDKCLDDKGLMEGLRSQNKTFTDKLACVIAEFIVWVNEDRKIIANFCCQECKDRYAFEKLGLRRKGDISDREYIKIIRSKDEKINELIKELVREDNNNFKIQQDIEYRINWCKEHNSQSVEAELIDLLRYINILRNVK